MSDIDAALLDQQERDRALFDRIADEYCRKDLIASSRIAREHRLRRTLRVVDVDRYGTVLEVGCGAGFSAHYLPDTVDGFCGVDYSDNLIAYAAANNAVTPHVRFVSSDIMDYAANQPFDLIFAIGLLHHLTDIEASLAHLATLLKPGGWLVANEPHPGNPVLSLARALRKRVDHRYSSDQRELSAAELNHSFSSAGFTDLHVVPQGFLSTPLAEVPLSPQFLFAPLSRVACFADSVLEAFPPALMRHFSWNLVIAGRKPQPSDR